MKVSGINSKSFKRRQFLILFLISFFCYLEIQSQQMPGFKYFVGKSEPPSDWENKNFDDSLWLPGYGSIGYGDHDDSVIIEKTSSLYIRFSLDSFSNFPSNLDNVIGMVLNIDYDDGFVAYLNGSEILRENIEELSPSFNQTTSRSHEVPRYKYWNFLSGNNFNGFYIDSALFRACKMDSSGILAFQVHNDSINGSDLSFQLYIDFITDTADGDMGNGYYSDAGFKYFKRVVLDSSKLPIINIETDEFGFGDPYDIKEIIAHMGIISNNSDIFNKVDEPFNDYNGWINARIRGNITAGQPKASYAFETQDSARNDINVKLLGLPKENDWILYGPYLDKSQIRDELIFDLGRKMGYYEPRTRFCELILNGENRGLYILTEKIKRDKNRVDIAKLTPDDNDSLNITGGYIFRFDHTTNIEIVYPENESITSEQKNYLFGYFNRAMRALNGNNFRDYDKGYRKYFDQKSLIDFILMTEFSKNIDGYNGSVYMYKDRDDKYGKICFGPIWDFDLTMESSPLGFFEGDRTIGWLFGQGSFFNINRYLQDSSFVNELINRWAKLRQSAFRTDSIYSLIDSILKPIRPYIDRNYQVWPVISKPTMVIFDTAWASYDDEINALKIWIGARTLWMDSNIGSIYVPLVKYPSEINISPDNYDYINIYPNPFRDELNLSVFTSEPGDMMIDIYDLSGRIVYSNNENYLNAGINSILINTIGKFNSGIYVMKIWRNNILISISKIIKTN
jgi:hypothetical protein